MTEENAACLAVVVYARAPIHAETFEQDLRRQLLRHGLRYTFQYVNADESLRCNAVLSMSGAPESVFDGTSMERRETLDRILQWLRDSGILSTEAGNDPVPQSSSIEEETVLRRLTDLGYL